MLVYLSIQTHTFRFYCIEIYFYVTNPIKTSYVKFNSNTIYCTILTNPIVSYDNLFSFLVTLFSNSI